MKTNNKQLHNRSMETLFPMIVLLVGVLLFFSLIAPNTSDIVKETSSEVRG